MTLRAYYPRCLLFVGCMPSLYFRQETREEEKKSENLGLTILHARLETHSFHYNHRKYSALSLSHPLSLSHTHTHTHTYARTTHILEGVSSPSKCMIHILRAHCTYIHTAFTSTSTFSPKSSSPSGDVTHES